MTQPIDVHEYAQAYVDRVLEKQRESGHEPRLSDEAYSAAIERAAEGFASLTDREERPDEDAVPV